MHRLKSLAEKELQDMPPSYAADINASKALLPKMNLEEWNIIESMKCQPELGPYLAIRHLLALGCIPLDKGQPELNLTCKQLEERATALVKNLKNAQKEIRGLFPALAKSQPRQLSEVAQRLSILEAALGKTSPWDSIAEHMKDLDQMESQALQYSFFRELPDLMGTDKIIDNIINWIENQDYSQHVTRKRKNAPRWCSRATEIICDRLGTLPKFDRLTVEDYSRLVSAALYAHASMHKLVVPEDWDTVEIAAKSAKAHSQMRSS